jgi:hypothetical protein
MTPVEEQTIAREMDEALRAVSRASIYGRPETFPLEALPWTVDHSSVWGRSG